jgi:uncharacterized damage-inducible protein DinB
MSLKSANTDILSQLTHVISQLNNADYARPLDVLSGNSIGRHIRHILEFYQLLVDSTRTGRLNYDRRERDLQLEADASQALGRINVLDQSIQQLDLHQPLHLEADLSVAGGRSIQIPSSFARELLYNLEHAIHHMALVQVAVRDSFPEIKLPPHFGVAYSTVQHQTAH